MGMTWWRVTLAAAGAAVTLLALALGDGACHLVDVVVNGAIGVDVDVLVALDLQRSDLLDDFIEAIGRQGAIRERQRSRRHHNASNVKQRHKSSNAASYPAGRNSKHRLTALDLSVLEGTRR
jgi:hypothetical protein